MFELCASILAADFANLERDMRAANAAGVDAFHRAAPTGCTSM